MQVARLHVRISGRVQGVGFRYFVQEQAEALNLKGWVRNLADGQVESSAEGTPLDLEKWLEALRQGPPLSRVDHLEITWRQPEEIADGFRVVA